MDETPPAPTPSKSQPDASTVLHYAAANVPGSDPYAGQSMVVVARRASTAEAGLYKSVLDAAGIAAAVIDQNAEMTTSLYTGGSDVKVVVGPADAERAAAILRDAASGALEPADEDPNAGPPVDEDGNAVTLELAAAFDHPRLLLDAAATLSAARVRVYLPKLVSRGDRPAGEGKRFLLRVEDDEADRARALLSDAEEGEAEEPRCPQCRSFRLWKTGGGVMHALGRLFGGAGRPEGYECLACKFRGEAAAFVSKREGD